MAYNRNNYLVQVKRILTIYNAEKKEHIPDTYIVRVVFPKHNINISYRTWVNIKGLRPSDLAPKPTQLIAV